MLLGVDIGPFQLDEVERRVALGWRQVRAADAVDGQRMAHVGQNGAKHQGYQRQYQMSAHLNDPLRAA